MKYIEVTIDPRGGVKVETSGFSGETCREATKALENRLGLVESETLTDEYHHEVEQNHETA